MFLTNVLFKKVKAKDILVCLESIVSGHKINLIRTRLGDKMEIIRYDPWKWSVFTKKRRRYEVCNSVEQS